MAIRWRTMCRKLLLKLTCVPRQFSNVLLFLCSCQCFQRRRVPNWWQYQRIMNRTYRIAPDSHSSDLQIPTRFLGEIHIFLTSLIIAACIAILVTILVQVKPEDTDERHLMVFGYVLYVVLTLVSSIVDLGLSVLLIFGAKQNSIDKCLIWFRGTLTLLLLFSLITVAFGAMLKSALVLIALIPGLIFKPFAMWVVNGFIDDLIYLSASCKLLVRSSDGAYNSAEEIGGGDAEEGERSSPIKKTTVFILTDEEREEDVERRTLILQTASRDQDSDPVPGPSTKSKAVRFNTITIHE